MTERGGFVIRDQRVVFSSLEENIRFCLRTLLQIKRGEITLHPEMGSDLIDLVFRRYTPGLVQEIRERIEKAISRFESRISFEGADIQPTPAHPSALTVTIRYRIKGTQKQESLKVAL